MFEEKWGSMMGVVGLVMGLVLVFGLIIFGVVLKFIDWYGLFVVFIMVVILLILISFIMIKDVMVNKFLKLDLFLIVMLLGFVGILYVVNEIGKFNVNWMFGWLLLVVLVLVVVYFIYC